MGFHGCDAITGEAILRGEVQHLAASQNGKDFKARRLDCSVFNLLHVTREEAGAPAYDTVRGLFWEGDELYPGAGVRQGNHIQICVRRPGCILGYFRPVVPTSL